ncbi:MAG: GlxA family transcriptional regulator [Sphingomonadales bacterium]|jgi:transcriptional regulator GlxA family with amidase domain
MTNAGKHIIIVAYPGVQNLDITGPWEVFASAALEQKGAYRLSLVSLKGGAIETSSHLSLTSKSFEEIDDGDVDTVLVPGGHGSFRAARDTALLAEIKRLGASARRVASVCTGSFILGAAEFLKGKRATTHWQACDLMAKHHPDVSIDRHSVYVQDGPVWTSAGVTTGIDMTLAMVAEDLGRDVAMKIARHLIVYHHRPGYQTQFSTLLKAQSLTSGPFSDLIDWISSHLSHPLKVEDLAERVGMTPRSFHRKFTEATGRPPGKFVERLRLDAARRLLAETDISVKEIAAQLGYQGSVGFIQAFERHLGLSPTSYRHLHGTRPIVPD